LGGVGAVVNVDGAVVEATETGVVVGFESDLPVGVVFFGHHTCRSVASMSQVSCVALSKVSMSPLNLIVKFDESKYEETETLFHPEFRSLRTFSQPVPFQTSTVMFSAPIVPPYIQRNSLLSS